MSAAEGRERLIAAAPRKRPAIDTQFYTVTTDSYSDLGETEPAWESASRLRLPLYLIASIGLEEVRRGLAPTGERFQRLRVQHFERFALVAQVGI